jgi:2-amino-4-hydroxy-6-hydroxymethyldihydropteridine diphosphokinase
MTKDRQKKQEIGIVIKQDMLENQAKIAFLAIGSNLGNKERNICLAKYKLQTHEIKLIKSSSNYETLSWPNKKNPKFINAVIKISTTLSPMMLMQKCLNIENDLGRKRSKKNEPRICDIDIIDYGQKALKVTENKKLILPHPEMHKRNFVLLPLYEIAQSWIHPVNKIKINKLIKLLDIEDLRAIKLI